MKTFRILFLVIFAALSCCNAFANGPDTNDPSLALWLDAGSLSSLADGDPVSLWTDLSMHGTTMEPNTATIDGVGDPAEMNPSYVASNPAFNGMPTVRFSRTDGGLGDPNVPFSGSFDRLYQSNNLGAGDPLDIGNGSDLTVFAVYQLNSVAANGESTEAAFNTILA